MTDREKAIVMAFTGTAMLTGEKFDIYHKYIQDIMGRPIWTHELADASVMEEIKDKSWEDFINVCNSEDLIDTVLKIIDDTRSGILDTHYNPTMKWAFERIKGAVEALKGGEQE